MAGPTSDQLLAALRQADAAGDEAGAQRLAQLYQSQLEAEQGNTQPSDYGQDLTVTARRGVVPADEALGTDTQNYLAGVGKSIVDTARGAAQTGASLVANAVAPVANLYRKFGNEEGANAVEAPERLNQSLKHAQTEANARDEPLMNTKAGTAGDISGNVAMVLAPGATLKALRAAELPGALSGVGEGVVSRALLPESVSGAAAQGAVQGGIQPLAADQADSQRVTNAAVGAAAGGAGSAIPQVIGGTARAIGSALGGFTKGGRASILADLAKRFGVDATEPVASQVPGVQPTLSEATVSPNAANLERALQQQAGAQGDFAQRASANNAARYQFLRDAVGTPETTDALRAARAEATSPLYNLARNLDSERQAIQQGSADVARQQGALIPGQLSAGNAAADAIANQVPSQILPLMQRPAFQQAVKDAAGLMAERGKPGANPLTSIEGLQAIKTSLDNMVNFQPGNSAATFDRNAVIGTRKALIDALGEISPQQRAADAKFAELSAPIDAEQVGQELLKRGTSGATDTAGVPTLRRESLAGAVRNGDTIAANVTGRANATAANTLSPDQLGAFRTVLGDLARSAEAQGGSMPKGSPTLQNAISQNILSRIGAVPGLGAFSEAGPVRGVASALDTLYKAFPYVQNALQDEARNFVLNPMSPEARAILAKLNPSQRQTLERMVAPYSAQAAQALRESAQQ